VRFPGRVLIAVTFASCLGSAQQPAPTIQHIVVKVEGGNVTFKRPAWRQFTAARFGTVLQEGDLLNLPSTGSATIVCDGFANAVAVAGPGIKPVPCSGSSAKTKPSEWNKVPVIPTAHIDLPIQKHLALLGMARTYETKPIVNWLSIPGADEYSIEVSGENFAWTGTTTGTSITLDRALGTSAGLDLYNVSVTPMAKHKMIQVVESTARLLRDQRFAVVSRITDNVLVTTADGLEKLGLPEPVLKFLKAKLYALFGSYDVAISSLESLQGILSEPARDRTLGEIYAAKGSLAEAEGSLARAATMYEKDSDSFGRALTDEAIAGVLLKAENKRAAAVARLTAALHTYQALGDEVDATRVKTLLDGLAPLLSQSPKR
jgi:hypothetical protein